MMAQGPVSPRLPPSPNASSGLLASCKGIVYLFKAEKWDPLFGNNIYKLHLVRQGGNFILFVVDSQPNLVVKAKILLRFNTIFKQIKQNFFSLLDNGILVWGFQVTSQLADAQTFAVVIQNTLISLKETNRPVLSTQQSSPAKLPEPKREQPDYLNNICLTLSDAISRGDQQFASNLAQQLAARKARVKIRIDDPEQDKLTGGVKDNIINIKVQVEDKESAGCSFRLDVAPQVTIRQLTQMVQAKYNFPSEIQRWIIGKRLSKPNESLLDCGIKASGDTVYLYLISADSAGIDRGTVAAWGERQEPALNRANSESDMSAAQQVLQNEVIPRNDPRSLPNMPSVRVREPPRPVIGWKCPMCTFVNSPSRPGCEMCSTDRPADYQPPQDYVPDERERARLEQAQAAEQMLFEEVMATRENASANQS